MPVVIYLDIDKSMAKLAQTTVLLLCEKLSALGKILYLRNTAVLDVDKKGKDSDKLFSAGLDYCILACDSKQYIKAAQPFLEEIDLSSYQFVVTETDNILPTYILQITDKVIGNSDLAKVFSVTLNNSKISIHQQLDMFIKLLGRDV